jgi:hypothetical protein
MDTENPRAYACLGETVIKSNMTLGQAIEAIAFAHIKTKLPQLGDNFCCWQVCGAVSRRQIQAFLMSDIARVLCQIGQPGI